MAFSVRFIATVAGPKVVQMFPFHRYARAGAAGYSMITGCSPRYSRVTRVARGNFAPGLPQIPA
jgi:hypothetical protein